MTEYKLHSHSEKWFHFRKENNSYNESFTITYINDGTIVMTGDMGCLCFQREYFPEIPDYGFPNKETNISYFSEKIVRAEESQKIKTWNKDLAKIQIKSLIDSYQEEDFENTEEDQNNITTLEIVYDSIDNFEDNDYGHFQMLDAFESMTHTLDSEIYYECGEIYTSHFIRVFELIKSVSHLILETVNKNNTIENLETYPLIMSLTFDDAIAYLKTKIPTAKLNDTHMEVAYQAGFQDAINELKHLMALNKKITAKDKLIKETMDKVFNSEISISKAFRILNITRNELNSLIDNYDYQPTAQQLHNTNELMKENLFFLDNIKE